MFYYVNRGWKHWKMNFRGVKGEHRNIVEYNESIESSPKRFHIE